MSRAGWCCATVSGAASNDGGTSNVIVKLEDANSGRFELRVNTIGSYRGIVPRLEPALVEVTSDGSWSITTQ